MHIAKVGAALLRVDARRIARDLKKRWMREIFSYGMHQRDEVARFNRLYLIRDPWAMNCERERIRFRETNRLITENFGRPHSLLEIGCGEGLQSSELQQICDTLYGVDVSVRAVRRAKRRCPQATFAVSDMYRLTQFMPLARFDLVTACEVLYYMTDVPGALRRLSELGQACLISYYDGAREEMDKHVAEIPGVKFESIPADDGVFTVAWWRC
jgi:2-polyprenyl-3-methyl-5-hydroxy-6-metoxy-1,4-benzoquinol methylase